jgi:hypothetical protein
MDLASPLVGRSDRAAGRIAWHLAEVEQLELRHHAALLVSW